MNHLARRFIYAKRAAEAAEKRLATVKKLMLDSGMNVFDADDNFVEIAQTERSVLVAARAKEFLTPNQIALATNTSVFPVFNIRRKKGGE